MKSDRQFSFEISGEIFRPESRQDNYYDDNELLSILKENEYNIKTEIEKELYHYSREFGQEVRIEVNLRFERGSILATGWVMIEFMGSIAGAVSFFEYFNRLINYIRRAIQNVIRRNLPNNGGKYSVSINVIPTNYPSSSSSNINNDSSLDLFKISPSKVLVGITLINIMLFIGGTLFTTIKVPSILEKYAEAEGKFKEAVAQYDSAAFMLKTTKLDYQFKQQEIENIKNEVLQKKESMLNSMSNDTLQIKADVTNIDTRLILLSNQIKELNQQKEEYEKSLKVLNESITKLQNDKVKFSFPEIWCFMSMWLKIIVGIIIMATSLTIVISIIYIIRLIRN